MKNKFVLLASGNMAGSALLFLRNIAIARLLGPEDYGIAATFAMLMAVVEMMSQIGMHQIIVQDDDGDSPDLQASLHGFHLLRSIATGVIIFLVAAPAARFMGIPDVAWAFQMLALPRIAFGFLHYDIYRLQREMAYLPLMSVYVLTPFVALVVVFPLAHAFGDYRVMLYSILCQEVARSVISHLVSRRSYRLAFDPVVFRRSLRFGWPLLVNSFFLLVAYNGEKMVVGREMGMQQLAIYAMGITLTMTPALIGNRILESLFLPKLSAAKHQPQEFSELAYAAVQGALLNGLINITASVTAIAFLIVPVLGSEFAPVIPLLAWLAILQATRDSKSVSLIALAKGRTICDLVANSCRVISLPVAWWAAANGHPILTIIWIAIAGELFGTVVGLYLLRSVIRLSLRPLIPSYLLFYAFQFAVAFIALSTRDGPMLSSDEPGNYLAIAVSLSVALFALNYLWRAIRPSGPLRS